MYFPIAAILLLIIVNATSTEPAYALFFGHSIDISNNTKLSSEPHLSLSRKSNVYVVWSDDTTGNGDIYFRASADNGTTFSKVKRLSNNTGSSTEPQIATSGKSNVYVVWSDDTTGNGDIYFRMSKDNGNTFSGIKNLSRNSTGSSTEPQIATSGKSNVYVVWSDDTTGDIYFRASENNGSSFNNTRVLSRNSTGSSTEPQIATSGNNVYVIWRNSTSNNTDIFFLASGDGAAHFDMPINLSKSSLLSGSHQIATSGNNVYVVWEDGITIGKGDIYFKRISEVFFP